LPHIQKAKILALAFLHYPQDIYLSTETQDYSWVHMDNRISTINDKHLL